MTIQKIIWILAIKNYMNLEMREMLEMLEYFKCLEKHKLLP